MSGNNNGTGIDGSRFNNLAEYKDFIDNNKATSTTNATKPKAVNQEKTINKETREDQDYKDLFNDYPENREEILGETEEKIDLFKVIDDHIPKKLKNPWVV